VLQNIVKHTRDRDYRLNYSSQTKVTITIQQTHLAKSS